MIFPCISHHCKPVPVQSWGYEYGLLTYTQSCNSQSFSCRCAPLTSALRYQVLSVTHIFLFPSSAVTSRLLSKSRIHVKQKHLMICPSVNKGWYGIMDIMLVSSSWRQRVLLQPLVGPFVLCFFHWPTHLISNVPFSSQLLVFKKLLSVG